MKKLRVSWTILQSWGWNKRDDVVKMIMGEKVEANEAMKFGARVHRQIANAKMKLLPFINLKTAIYEDSKTNQTKFEVDLFDWLTMAGVVDVMDPVEKYIIDWKTGGTSSLDANKLQLYCYAYCLSKLDKPVEVNKAYVARVEKDRAAIIVSDYSEYKITPQKLELAENYIETYASEIYNFLYDDYGKSKV